MRPKFKKITTVGKLSVVEGQLLLDGTPLPSGQIILSKDGGGRPLPGRIFYDTEGRWNLDREEFIGHTYLDLLLDDHTLSDLVVIGIEV